MSLYLCLNHFVSHFVYRDDWNSLQDAIQIKGKKLAGAYDVHKFIRDTKDTLMRIKDKEASIQVDDLGKSIQSVLALQRKMETFEREVAALGTKVGGSCWYWWMVLMMDCTYK